jgi:L-gulonolactone oxidase
MLSSGEVVKCSASESEDLFHAALCSLGSLGIILTVTLKVEPSFNLRAETSMITFSHMISNWNTLVHSAQHVRFWFFPYTDNVVLWRADRCPNSHTAASGTTGTCSEGNKGSEGSKEEVFVHCVLE